MKKMVLMALFASLCYGMSLSAQGWTYSTLDGTYSYNSYNDNYYMFLNQNASGPQYNKGFRLIDGPHLFNPIFQVDTHGAMTFGSRNGDRPASLTFMQGNVGYGQINTSAQNLNLEAARQVRIKVRNGHEAAIFDNTAISFFDNLSIQREDIRLRVGLDDEKAYGWIGTISDDGLYIGANSHASIFLDNNYGVYVGLHATEVNNIRPDLKESYRLFVRKGVLSEDFAVAPVGSWADFVFHSDYRLRPLSEVENFIRTNKHLPDVPSAKDVAEKGYSQHEINKVLLQKVEELTLYILEQQKEIEALKAKLEGQTE